MSSLAAASLVIGLLLLGVLLIAGVLWLWGSLHKEKSPDDSTDTPAEPAKPLTEEEVRRIETELGVTLPPDFREFLMRTRDEFDPDDVSVLSDADQIIELSREYRDGFAGLPPWPKDWVYVGDESDACPYYLECESGKLARLHKGDLRQKALRRYRSFASYLEQHRRESARDAEVDKQPLTWRDNVRFYLPLAIVLFFMFVILPAIGFGVTSLFRWLSKP